MASALDALVFVQVCVCVCTFSKEVKPVLGLGDLQVLTWIFMEDSTDEHYTVGARIMTLTATASTVEENNLLQFALQHLHSICPPFERPSSSALIQWLWQHHLDSLQGPAFELSDLQTFFEKAGGQRMIPRRWPTKLVVSWEGIWDAKSCTCFIRKISSCLLHHQETRNIFFHVFGA